MKYSIILASGSPRRRELMDRIGSEYICIPSGKEEDMSGHDPRIMVEMLSSMKAEDIADKIINGTLSADDIRAGMPADDKAVLVSALTSQESSCVIIGCDTVVAFENRILGKPKNAEDAFDMIKSFAGRAHHVHTGVCILVIENKKTVKKPVNDKKNVAKATAVIKTASKKTKKDFADVL